MTECSDYPLYVVTTAAGAERSGCIAGFVTQASIEPVRYLVCLSTVNHTFGVAVQSQHLALHLLGSSQHDLAALFGEQTGDEVDKFEEVSWTTGSGGSPILASCAAWVEGTILQRWNVGDHEAFLISVDHGGLGPATGRFMFSDGDDIEAGHPVSTSEADAS